MTDDDLVVVSKRELLNEIPCVCSLAYTERGLEAPDCRHHDLERALDDCDDPEFWFARVRKV